MVRLLPTLACAAWLALPAGSAEPAAGPSVGHPLSPLCDLICGGTWQPDHPAFPDEDRTTMHFAWDAESRTVRGEAVRSGGITGRRSVVAIVFNVDERGEVLTVARMIEGRPPVTGVVALGADGFKMRFASPSEPAGSLTTIVRFEDPDLWIEHSEILSQGSSTLSTEARYRRTPE